MIRLWYRIQARYRDHSQTVRRPLRRLRRSLSIVLYRLRGRVSGEPLPPRVVTAGLPEGATRAVPHPAIAVVVPEGANTGEVDRFLAGQTEKSVTCDEVAAAAAPYLLHAGGPLAELPATHLESQLLAAVAEELDWTVAGWAAPADGRFGPSGTVLRDPSVGAHAHCLLRRPHADRQPASSVQGRAVAHITGEQHLARCIGLSSPTPIRCGPYSLSANASPGSVVHHGVHSVSAALARLPDVPGPSTALFLMSFLAVGGAERLLFDLFEGLVDRYRLLVVTTDPHLAHLDQTVDRCRELTPHVYTLGDWLPQEAHASALRHLMRRWRVEALMSWNGTTLFYDELGALRREHPDMRIVNQLFNHEGGWIEHYSPSVVRSVDTHVAVNDRIARALQGDRGVPADRIATIHHAVAIPSEARDPAQGRALRDQLGLPLDCPVVGTFIRMHPQKRPLDVIRLARRMADTSVHFLLVGGGPLDGKVGRELAADSPTNLTRLPMRRDTDALYDAVDVCLLTSSYEGLPVFLLDGLARSIPCVATAVGEISELLANGGGLVVDRPGDLDALQAAIESLLDPEVRQHQGDRGRETVAARFGLDRYVREYERVLFR